MTQPNDGQLPEDLLEVAEQLRTRRTDSTALELDEIKRRAMAQASISRRGPESLTSRVIAFALVAGLVVGGGTAGAIAAGGGDGSAASSQYKPGKGCGKPVKTGPPGNPSNSPATCPPKH